MASTEPSVVKSSQTDKRFGQAIMLFAVSCLLMMTVGFGSQAISPLVVGLAITLVFVLLLPAVLFVRWKGVPVKEGLRLRPIQPALIVTSLLAGVGGWGLAFGLAIFLKNIGMPSMPSPLSTNSFSMMLMMLLAGAVMPGVCEECLFRGAIQGVLERRGKWFAIIFAGVLFGLFHMEPIRIVCASLLGIFFGWLVVRTGSIIPAMLAHFANNATAISAGYFLDFEESMFWLVPTLAILWGVAMFAIVRLTASEKFQSNVQPSPLESVPAGVPPAVAWGCGIPGVLAGLMFIAGIVTLGLMIAVVSVDDDALAPKVNAGDQILVMKSSSPVFKIRTGQVVVFKRGEETLARKVTRFEGSKVWVADSAGNEVQLGEADLIGYSLQVIPSNGR
jgi:membrane protease YdiL (CAAX protease family)